MQPHRSERHPLRSSRTALPHDLPTQPGCSATASRWSGTGTRLAPIRHAPAVQAAVLAAAGNFPRSRAHTSPLPPRRTTTPVQRYASARCLRIQPGCQHRVGGQQDIDAPQQQATWAMPCRYKLSVACCQCRSRRVTCNPSTPQEIAKQGPAPTHRPSAANAVARRGGHRHRQLRIVGKVPQIATGATDAAAQTPCRPAIPLSCQLSVCRYSTGQPTSR